MVVPPSIDEMYSTSCSQREMCGGFAYVARSGAELLVLLRDDDGHAGDAREYFAEMADPIARPMQNDQHNGGELSRQCSEQALDIFQTLPA